MDATETYIQWCEAQNPKLFAAGKIQITPDALRAALRHAHEHGMEYGRLSQKTDSIFDQVFGKGCNK